MSIGNATITYSVSGIGWTKEKTIRGRVTQKRVMCSVATWDKSGRRIGTVGMYHYELIKFILDGSVIDV